MRRAPARGDMQASLPLTAHRTLRERWFPNGEWVLLLALALEIAIFAATAKNFFTVGNFFEVIRLSVELGLLALALTPVIVTGGIDLSVGSMMGLAAVLLRRGLARLALAHPGRGALCAAARLRPAARSTRC